MRTVGGDVQVTTGTISQTLAQFTLRCRDVIPIELRGKYNQRVVGDAIEDAWTNGWRDHEWLMTCALEGTGHSSISDPVALFVANLKRTAEQPCPIVVTPTPKYDPPRREHGPADADRVTAYIAEARRLLHTGEGSEVEA